MSSEAKWSSNPLSMTRNEDSTLFSLGDLERAVAARRSSPATRAPASEGSGLIDIQAMRAMMDGASARADSEDTRESARAAPDPVPAFMSMGLSGLAADHLIEVAPAPAPRAPARPRGPSAALVALLGVLSLGVLALGAYVVFHEPPTPQVQRELVVAPALEDSDGAAEANEAEAEAEASEAEAEAGEASEAEAEAEASEAKAAERPRRPTRNRRRNQNQTQTTKATSTSKTEPGAKEIDVDCLINNKLPKCKPTKPTKTAETKVEATKPEPKPSSDLPAKLGQSQILAGIRPIKTSAKSCGSGTTVAIKFSVDGASGRVIAARPLDAHTSTSVGKCVAEKAKAASFAKFAAPQQGFTFNFRL